MTVAVPCNKQPITNEKEWRLECIITYLKDLEDDHEFCIKIALYALDRALLITRRKGR